MQLNQATSIATNVLQELEPFCDRIQIGGSIRRKKKQVKDIEIICIPKQVGIPGQTDLFGQPAPTMVRDQNFCSTVDQWKFIKGQSTGKHIQREDSHGHQIDIFIADQFNWGYILLLRTGSKEFNMNVIEKLKDHGYRCRDGQILKNGYAVPVREEQDIFRLCRMEYVRPEAREHKKKFYHA